MRLTKAEAKALGVPDCTNKPKCFRSNGADPLKKAAKNRLYEGDKVFDAMCKAHGLPFPVPEFQFAAPERLWAVDYCFDGWLCLEVEGGAWTQGRHTRGAGFLADIEKYNELAIRGYMLIRCTPEDIKTGAAFALVKRALGSLEEQP